MPGRLVYGFRMQTTLDIDSTLMQRARQEAARRGTTVAAIVEAGPWQMLEAAPPDGDTPLPPLPTWHGGGPPLVDVADRRKLYEALDAD